MKFHKLHKKKIVGILVCLNVKTIMRLLNKIQSKLKSAEEITSIFLLSIVVQNCNDLNWYVRLLILCRCLRCYDKNSFVSVTWEFLFVRFRVESYAPLFTWRICVQVHYFFELHDLYNLIETIL